MKHTKEPWEADGYGAMNRITDGHETIGYTDPIIRARSKQEDVAEGESNAKRIVACVNACAGIRTEALESGLIKHLLNDAYMRTLNPFDPNPQSKMDMKYLGKPVYEEDFEEVENGKD